MGLWRYPRSCFRTCFPSKLFSAKVLSSSVEYFNSPLFVIDAYYMT